MKKTLSIIFFVLVSITLLFTLCACPANNDDITEKEKLTAEEKEFLDMFKAKIYSFKDPASVKLISINSGFDGELYKITVSAANSYGAAVTSEYLLFSKTHHFTTSFSDIPSGTLIKMDGIADYLLSLCTDTGNRDAYAESVAFVEKYCENFKADKVTYSVKNINDALTEYKIEKGLVSK